MEILWVNGFIEWSANISGSIRGLFCIVSFYCWLGFMFGENLCEVKELWSDWLESLEVGCCCPWRYPPKSTIVIWKQEPLEFGCIYYSSTQIELSNKNQVLLEDLVFHAEFRNSKKAWKPKRKEKKWEEFKSTKSILYYIQNSKREFKFNTNWKRREKKERNRRK